MTQTPEHGFGWWPDLPDFRDWDVALPKSLVMLPAEVRLDELPAMPAVYDQGQLGSCTANALAAAVEFDLRRQSLTDFQPSRLFIYYNERLLEHTTAYDSGAYIRDGAKSIHRIGVCDEAIWPYDPNAFATLPPQRAYDEAKLTRSVKYARVARSHMREVLASGTPFTIGFTVYENFMQIGDDGVMPMPAGSVLGGHAVLVVGYALINGRLYYRVRNSWGDAWGEAGYFWMPAQVLENSRISQDFWAIQTVS